jgi:ABC-2 type transport system ATP-binding protein
MFLSTWLPKRINMDSPAIYVDNLTRRFGDFVAVDHVSFDVRPSEIVGYLGPNGSGKTTTIRMLLGLLKPSEGSANVLGFDIARQSEQIRAVCGYMSQKFAIYDDMTVWENLQFYAGVYGIVEKSEIQKTMAHIGLTDQARILTRELSTGWRQRLALGIALVHSPRLLFLDEPTSGVDPNARRTFWDLIYDLSAQGVTILVTTHYMDEAEYCNRVGIMREGHLLALDTPSMLKATALPGLAWDILAEPLMNALTALEKCPMVLRAGLAGDHLRAITKPDVKQDDLFSFLSGNGLAKLSVERVEPSLEDVFLALAIPQKQPDV